MGCFGGLPICRRVSLWAFGNQFRNCRSAQADPARPGVYSRKMGYRDGQDAAASNDFRRQVWTIWWKEYFPRHPLLGRGFGFRSQWARTSVVQHSAWETKQMVETGNIHNGLFSAMDALESSGQFSSSFGIFGMLGRTFRVPGLGTILNGRYAFSRALPGSPDHILLVRRFEPGFVFCPGIRLGRCFPSPTERDLMNPGAKRRSEVRQTSRVSKTNWQSPSCKPRMRSKSGGANRPDDLDRYAEFSTARLVATRNRIGGGPRRSEGRTYRSRWRDGGCPGNVGQNREILEKQFLQAEIVR